MRPTPETIERAVKTYGGYRPAARHLLDLGFEISERSIRRAVKKDFTVDEEVVDSIASDFESLYDRRVAEFAKKHRDHKLQKIVPIRVNIDGPIGLGFMGDPHIDDDGTDIKKLFQHADLFDGSTEGLYAGCLGDMWNNWTGRISHLWKEQGTSADEAKVLVEEFLTRIDWLFVVFGNHDAWSGHSDILPYILKNNAQVQKKFRLNLGLKFSNGRNCKIMAAHDFPGRSMWFEAFGPAKRAQLDGCNNIYVCGDTHTSAYTHGWHDGNEMMWHAIRVGSYKTIDRYAEELNLLDRSLYQCPVALIDPNASNELNFIRWEFDPNEAKERIKWMRNRYKKGKSAT